MVNFILPHLYFNNRFNSFLKGYILSNPEKTNFTEKVNIFAEYGNFPFSFWHGGINTNSNSRKIFLQDKVSEYCNKSVMPIIIDCSNFYLNTSFKWLKDPHLKMILSEFENRGNYIKVSNSLVKDAIEKEYPGYWFILKYNNDKEEKNLNNFSYIEILNNIPSECKKSQILYPLLNRCKNCFEPCEEIENLYQFTFSSLSKISKCRVNSWDGEQILKEYKEARQKGYTYFYFGEVTAEELENFNNFLINFFIKPEYQDEFIMEVTKQ